MALAKCSRVSKAIVVLGLAVFCFLTFPFASVASTRTLLPLAFFHGIALWAQQTLSGSPFKLVAFPKLAFRQTFAFDHTLPNMAKAILWVGLATAVLVSVALFVVNSLVVVVQFTLSKVTKTSGGKGATELAVELLYILTALNILAVNTEGTLPLLAQVREGVVTIGVTFFAPFAPFAFFVFFDLFALFAIFAIFAFFTFFALFAFFALFSIFASFVRARTSIIIGFVYSIHRGVIGLHQEMFGWLCNANKSRDEEEDVEIQHEKLPFLI